MTAKNLNQLIADQHIADLRHAAERERAVARPRRRRRAPVAILLAALLVLTFAASANAAGRVWVDTNITNLDYVLGKGPDVVFTVHNDTDTVLATPDIV